MGQKLRVGISFNDGTQYFVGKLPGRKRECLYMVEGSVLTVLAHSITEENANKIERMFTKITG